MDVCQVLTDQQSIRGASTYWAVLKKRLIEEGANQLLTNCKQLKMKAADGKMRKTDCATTEQLLRIIQSIPSPKAEPFKQWMRSIEIRKEMTDEWKRAGISTPPEYAALTNVLIHAWSGKTVQEYKTLKGLKKENLRDNMTNTELVLNQLAEISTTELSRNMNPQGYSETENVTVAGGTVAANARKELEGLLGRSIISPLNATSSIQLDDTKKE